MPENCVQCGGFAHDTPGKYNGWPCGFCKGTGLVPDNTQWAQPVVRTPRPRRFRLIGLTLDSYLTIGAVVSLLWAIWYIFFTA